MFKAVGIVQNSIPCITQFEELDLFGLVWFGLVGFLVARSTNRFVYACELPQISSATR